MVGGLYLFDSEKDWFYNYRHDPKDISSLSDDDIWDITVDSNQNLWISTDGGGVDQFHPLFNRFSHTKHNPFDSQSLGVNDTYAFYEDDQHLWVGNNTLGLSRKNKADGSFYNYPFTENEKKSLLDFTVYAVAGDEKNNIWAGSYSGGLSRLNPSTGNFIHFVNAPDDSLPLPSNYIRKIVPRGENIWIGTGQGLGKLNIKTEKIDILPRMPRNKDFFGDIVTDIEFDAQGDLWACSVYGLFRMNPKTLLVDSTHTELDSIITHDLAIGKDGLWVGTEKGLALYQNEQLTWFNTKDGLSHNEVIGVEVDEQDRIWCITNNGLNLFDPTAKKFYSFFREDGLQSSQFNIGSIYKGKSGKLYAGGLNGFNSWQPNRFKTHTNEPKVVFTNYTIQNGDEITEQSLIQKEKITLKDDDNYLTVHFFSDEIIHKAKTKFAYRLREINKSWVEISDWKIQLTNLSTGMHTLDVKAKNYDGIWGDFSTLKIEVLPPIWATTEAYILYTLMIVSLFIFRDRYLKNQKRLLEQTVVDRTDEIRKQKELAEQDKEVIAKQNEQISKSLTERESLLKEIHHRVKNNLQIIASLLYLQSGKFEDEDFKKVLEEGQGRVRSMALIHQKLYENEDLKSIPFGEYLQELVSEIRASFGMRNIQLNIEAENIFFDVDTAVPLGLIVNEMATNAFKYAFDKEEKGSLSIFLTEENGQYFLNVKDDGKGIPDEIDIRKTKSLGLRLVRMLSQQLEGDFEFKNENGTSFELKFAA